MVGDLIDPVRLEWMGEWLEELFYADEVEMIKKIPLSVRNPDDRLIWHYGKHGLYTEECPLGLHARSHAATTMEGWIRDMMEELQPPQLSIFFQLLWAIWTERNKVVWQSSIFDPVKTVQWAMAQLLEFQSLKHGRSHAKSRREKAKWCFPPSGRLKLNIDGAYKEDGSGETEAYCLGLRMAIQHGWQNLEAESDCAILVAALLPGK
ncbi:hypothetical protein ACLB2K_022465 [Fragaria x ananassa]